MNSNQGNNQQSDQASQNIPKIRVVVRKRPLTNKEINKKDIDCLEVRSHKGLVVKEMK